MAGSGAITPDFIIYTYDNVEMIWRVLNGVAMIFTSGGGQFDFKALLKLLGMVGFLVALTSMLFKPGSLGGPVWFFSFILVYTVMMVPVSNVAIINKGVKPGASVNAMMVSNVPIFLAFVGSVTSIIGTTLTDAFDTVFSGVGLQGGGSNPISSYNKYSDTGVGFAHQAILKAQEANFNQPDIQADIQQFILNCAAYDVGDTYTAKALAKVTASTALVTSTSASLAPNNPGKGLWNALSHTNPAHVTTYIDASGAEVLRDCGVAWTAINGKIQTAGDELLKKYYLFMSGKEDGGGSSAAQAYESALAMEQIGTASMTVKDMLLHTATVNAVRKGFVTASGEGSSGGMLLALADAQAVASTNSSYIVQAKLAEQALPMIRNSIEAILYAIFPIVCFLCLILTGSALVSALKGYVLSFIWIQLWAPIYSIINYLGQVKLGRTLVETARHSDGTGGIGINMENFDHIYAGVVSDQAIVGWLLPLVPVIASAIIHGMNQAMGQLGGGSFVAQAGRAAEAAGSGNVQLGNVSAGQQNLGPTVNSAFKSTFSDAFGTTTSNIGSGGTQAISGFRNETFTFDRVNEDGSRDQGWGNYDKNNQAVMRGGASQLVDENGATDARFSVGPDGQKTVRQATTKTGHQDDGPRFNEQTGRMEIWSISSAINKDGKETPALAKVEYSQDGKHCVDQRTMNESTGKWETTFGVVQSGAQITTTERQADGTYLTKQGAGYIHPETGEPIFTSGNQTNIVESKILNGTLKTTSEGTVVNGNLENTLGGQTGMNKAGAYVNNQGVIKDGIYNALSGTESNVGISTTKQNEMIDGNEVSVTRTAMSTYDANNNLVPQYSTATYMHPQRGMVTSNDKYNHDTKQWESVSSTATKDHVDTNAIGTTIYDDQGHVVWKQNQSQMAITPSLVNSVVNTMATNAEEVYSYKSVEAQKFLHDNEAAIKFEIGEKFSKSHTDEWALLNDDQRNAVKNAAFQTLMSKATQHDENLKNTNGISASSGSQESAASPQGGQGKGTASINTQTAYTTGVAWLDSHGWATANMKQTGTTNSTTDRTSEKDATGKQHTTGDNAGDGEHLSQAFSKTAELDKIRTYKESLNKAEQNAMNSNIDLTSAVVQNVVDTKGKAALNIPASDIKGMQDMIKPSLTAVLQKNGLEVPEGVDFDPSHLPKNHQQIVKEANAGMRTVAANGNNAVNRFANLNEQRLSDAGNSDPNKTDKEGNPVNVNYMSTGRIKEKEKELSTKTKDQRAITEEESPKPKHARVVDEKPSKLPAIFQKPTGL